MGDSAVVPSPDGTPYPNLARHALREARQFARNIVSGLNGRPPQPFVYRTLGMMGSLGRYKAFGKLLGVSLHGFPAWFLRRTYYLLQMPGWVRRFHIMIDSTFALLFSPGRRENQRGQQGRPDAARNGGQRGSSGRQDMAAANRLFTNDTKLIFSEPEVSRVLSAVARISGSLSDNNADSSEIASRARTPCIPRAPAGGIAAANAPIAIAEFRDQFSDQKVWLCGDMHSHFLDALT